MIKCYELFTIFYAPACRGIFLNLDTNTVHKITGYKLCKIIFLLSSTSMPWISIINLYMSIKPEKYKYAFYTSINVRHQNWEQSVWMIWNWVCSFTMMGCIVGVNFVTVANQLPVRRGHVHIKSCWNRNKNTLLIRYNRTWKVHIKSIFLDIFNNLDPIFNKKFSSLAWKSWKKWGKYCFWKTKVVRGIHVFQYKNFALILKHFCRRNYDGLYRGCEFRHGCKSTSC
jgi:hypothetical protein